MGDPTGMYFKLELHTNPHISLFNVCFLHSELTFDSDLCEKSYHYMALSYALILSMKKLFTTLARCQGLVPLPL